MFMLSGASWRAASTRARLKEPRRRLPAKATMSATTAAVAWGRRHRVTQHEALRARLARLEMLGDGQRSVVGDRAEEVMLESQNNELAGPAGRVLHYAPRHNGVWRSGESKTFARSRAPVNRPPN